MEKQQQEKQQRLIWLDLEMTGLDPDSDSILEIATIVTDADLNELAEGPVYAIRHADANCMQWMTGTRLTMALQVCGTGCCKAVRR